MRVSAPAGRSRRVTLRFFGRLHLNLHTFLQVIGRIDHNVCVRSETIEHFYLRAEIATNPNRLPVNLIVFASGNVRRSLWFRKVITAVPANFCNGAVQLLPATLCRSNRREQISAMTGKRIGIEFDWKHGRDRQFHATTFRETSERDCSRHFNRRAARCLRRLGCSLRFCPI
jgi:hypothetical protein